MGIGVVYGEILLCSNELKRTNASNRMLNERNAIYVVRLMCTDCAGDSRVYTLVIIDW